MNSSSSEPSTVPTPPTGEPRPVDVPEAKVVAAGGAQTTIDTAQHNGNGLFNLAVVIENAEKMEAAVSPRTISALKWN